jgi:hypothetical protein
MSSIQLKVSVQSQKVDPATFAISMGILTLLLVVLLHGIGLAVAIAIGIAWYKYNSKLPATHEFVFDKNGKTIMTSKETIQFDPINVELSIWGKNDSVSICLYDKNGEKYKLPFASNIGETKAKEICLQLVEYYMIPLTAKNLVGGGSSF